MITRSKAWNWKMASAPWWEKPASEVYPLIERWKGLGFKKLLDLGCGIGRHSIFFAENDFRVEALDLSDSGITKLNEISRTKGLNISTQISDMLSLPYENNSFDCILAYHVVYHADEAGIEKTIKEIDRILKNSGEAFITFNSKNSSSYGDPKNQSLSDNVLIKKEGHEAGIPHYYADKKDVEKLLQYFKIIEFSYKEEYWPDYVGAHYLVLVKKK